jgi:hypothetical protein
LCDAQPIGKLLLNIEIRQRDLSLGQSIEKHTLSHGPSSQRKNALMP